MLNPNDVHLLVGILTQISRPSDVDIVLGDMVFDKIAQEDRDVDITVRTKKNSTTILFEGIEVKHHKRPLDVTHVEQLCAKLNDMPDLSERGIVSASGYSRAAIAKASHNKVALYELRDWPTPRKLGHITLSEKLQIEGGKYEWISPPKITFISGINKPKNEELNFTMNAPIIEKTGEKSVLTPTCNDLAHSLVSRSIALAESQGKLLGLADGETKFVTFRISLPNQQSTIVGGKYIPLEKAIISGEVKHSIKDFVPNYKGLFKYGDQQPFIACAIFEMQDRSLGGFVIDSNNTLSFLNININSRLMKKIYKNVLA